jgi:crossover junction endodeoxyribonuclease RusA
MTRRGRVYTPAQTLEYEQTVATFYDGPLFEGPLRMHVTFTKGYSIVELQECDKPDNYLRGDLDNYVKAVQDGLNGVAYADDRQIVRLCAVRL